jgi:hypothetical protein
VKRCPNAGLFSSRKMPAAEAKRKLSVAGKSQPLWGCLLTTLAVTQTPEFRYLRAPTRNHYRRRSDRFVTFCALASGSQGPEKGRTLLQCQSVEKGCSGEGADGRLDRLGGGMEMERGRVFQFLTHDDMNCDKAS